MKKIDVYIIWKFLGTFFFSLLLILSIAVVFDITEKIDDFIEKGAPLSAIVFDYYKNFIPYFANLFTPLFVFISVIFFTSKMASQTEIIAILSSGVSYQRLLFPYFISALIIAIFSFFLGSYIIPPANKVRLEFENKYVKNARETGVSDTHMQIAPGVFVYMGRFYGLRETGDYFSIEKFDHKRLVSKLSSQTIRYDSTLQKWVLQQYILREFYEDKKMKITQGASLDTTINIKPLDFKNERRYFETMNLTELSAFIKEQQDRGLGNVEEFVIEKYRRISSPFAAFILTLIGVSLASRKSKGGMGMNIGIGLGLSFAYILFMTVSTTFAISGSMSPLIAVWLPNFVFLGIGVYLYYKAPK